MSPPPYGSAPSAYGGAPSLAATSSYGDGVHGLLARHLEANDDDIVVVDVDAGKVDSDDDIVVVDVDAGKVDDDEDIVVVDVDAGKEDPDGDDDDGRK